MPTKRKKFFTREEILQKLEESGNKICEVSSQICEELCPFDVNDEEATMIEDRLERIRDVTEYMTKKIHRLKQAVKERRFQKYPEKLKEKEISCSQHSLFQSQKENSEEDSDECVPSEDGQSRPDIYRKKALDRQLHPKTRRRRVKTKVAILSQWAEEEGVTDTQLLGYFIYLTTDSWKKDSFLPGARDLTNYHTQDRELAGVGWRIFSKQKLCGKNEATLDEARWLIERASLSQAIYLELRLRFVDRFVLPAVMHVTKEAFMNGFYQLAGCGTLVCNY